MTSLSVRELRKTYLFQGTFEDCSPDRSVYLLSSWCSLEVLEKKSVKYSSRKKKKRLFYKLPSCHRLILSKTVRRLEKHCNRFLCPQNWKKPSCVMGGERHQNAQLVLKLMSRVGKKQKLLRFAFVRYQHFVCQFSWTFSKQSESAKNLFLYLTTKPFHLTELFSTCTGCELLELTEAAMS